MQKFAKKQIAVAVGASLLIMAGAAQAGVPAAAPAPRATKPVLATPTLQADADALYSTTGFTGTLPVLMNFTAPADSTSPVIGFAVVTGGFDGIKVNAANNAATTVGASVATDDIVVYAGTVGATQINLVVPNASAIFTPNANTSATGANAAFNIFTAGSEAVRLNATSGALEYTTDKNATTITWLPVSIGVQVPAQTGTVRNAITANDSTDVAPLDHEAATSTVIAAVAGQSLFNTVAPTASAKTVGTGGLVNGVEINTVTPLSAAIVVGSATTGIAFTSNVAGCSPGTDSNNAADIAAAAAVAPATGLTTAISGNLNTITFVGATTDWTTGAAAVDAAAYVSDCFNTGIATGSLPFNLGVTATPANLPTYSLVFDAAGANQVMTSIPTVTDGVAPTVTAATLGVAGTTTPLSLTFSEPMTLSTGAANAASMLREVAENVFLGSNSLAALNLNAGGTLSIPAAGAIAPTAGKSTMTISGIQTTDLVGKTVTVTTGIALQESNDTSYNSAVAAKDTLGSLSGGLFSTSASSGAEGASVTALATSTPVITIGFADTTASAATTTADANKIGLITVTFPTNRGVGYNTGKTFSNLTGQIVVTVTGNSAAGAPVTFQFFPTAIASGVPASGQMVLSPSVLGASNTLIINPPTDLIYSKITSLTPGSVTVQYLNLDNNVATNVLVGTIAAAPVVSSGSETVSLPLSATATSSDLLTQSITGTLSGASSGSLVHAHLMKWVETPTYNPATFSITSGRITDSGDKVATDLAIQYAPGDKAALEALIATQMNGVKPSQAAVPGVSNSTPAVAAASIPVYVQLVRSSDVQASSKIAQNYKEARAILSTVADDAAFYADSASGVPSGSLDVTPVYMVMLNPSTGAITGRLTGQLTIKRTEGSVSALGLGTVALNVAEGLVDSAGKFNLIVATEPSTSEISKGTKGLADQFVILVHEDQANTRRYTQLTSANKDATNYVPFEPNLYTLSGTRTVLGVAPGVAGKFTATTGSAATIPLSNQNVVTLNNSTAWQLFNMGTPAGTAGHAAPRSFVGIDSSTGAVTSYWTNDGLAADMAFAMAGNKVGVSTELATSTLSTIDNAKLVTGAATLAVKNDVAGATQTLTWAQAAPVAAKLAAGWSLATVPASGLNSTTVGAVLKVGAQSGGDVTWFKDDVGNGAITQFAAGTPVFVYSKAGGNLAQ